jgi:DNA-binding CsgD family transcriptional regulator
MVERLLSDLVRKDTGQSRRSFTLREEGVLELTSRGFKNSEIADALGISSETVRWHKRRLNRKISSPTENLQTVI